MRHRPLLLAASLAATLLPLSTAPVEAAAPSLVTPRISLVKWPPELHKGETQALRSSSSPSGLDTYVAGRDSRYPSEPVACATKTTGIGQGAVTGLKVSGGYLYCEVYAKRDATATTTSARSSTVKIKVYSSEPVDIGTNGACLSSCSWSDGTATPIILYDGNVCLQWYFSGAYNPNDPLSGWGVTYALCPQTIAFTQPPDRRWDQARTFPISARSSLGLTLATRVSTPAVCTISGLNVTVKALGRCTITASQPGNANVEAAAPVTRSFQVLKGNQTVTSGGPYSVAVGSSTMLNATVSSGLRVSYRVSGTPSICSVSGNTVSGLSAGSCTVVVEPVADPYWNPTFGVLYVQVTLRPQTLAFDLPDHIERGRAIVLNSYATAQSGLPVTFSSSTPAACSIARTGSTYTLTPLVTGATCTVTAEQAGNATTWQRAIRSDSATVVDSSRQNQTISFIAPANLPLNVPVTLTAAATSGLAVTFATTTPGVCSVSGQTVTGTVQGSSCTIIASQTGNGTWAAATPVTRIVAVETGSVRPS